LRIILNTVIHSNLDKNCVIYMTGIFIQALSIGRDDLTAAEMRMTRYFRVRSSKTDAGWFYKTVLLNNTLILLSAVRTLSRSLRLNRFATTIALVLLPPIYNLCSRHSLLVGKRDHG